MAIVTYNRPISKVGFRIMNQTNPQYAANLGGWSPTYGGLGYMGQTVAPTDAATLANNGFDAGQISQIISSYSAGSISDDGYQQLLSGTVDPSQLANFINADLGAPNTPPSAIMPYAGLQWLGQSFVAGIPNWVLVAFGAMWLFTRRGGGGRRGK